MPTPKELDRANLGRQAMADWSSGDKTLSEGKARRVSACRANQFQQFVTLDGRKFTELYNGASGKQCEMDGKPRGSIRGDESINVQHLTSNKLDGVCRVTICTIQRLYAMVHSLFSWLNKRSRAARSRVATGSAFCAFNDACGPHPLACLRFEIAISTGLVFKPSSRFPWNFWHPSGNTA